MIDYRLYLVTDNPSRYHQNWLESIEAAIKGGVTCVQYRDTENPPKMQYERILKLKDMLANYRIPLIVNNEAELAVAVNAEGVHVGQGDMDPEQVRKIVGPRCEIGLSITNLAQVNALKALPQALIGCIGIGPVYDAKKTKSDAATAMGLNGLRAIARQTIEFPNCAIGGITLDNAAQVVAAGARGLAVVSAFSLSADPYLTAQKFSAAIL